MKVNETVPQVALVTLTELPMLAPDWLYTNTESGAVAGPPISCIVCSGEPKLASGHHAAQRTVTVNVDDLVILA